MARAKRIAQLRVEAEETKDTLTKAETTAEEHNDTTAGDFSQLLQQDSLQWEHDPALLPLGVQEIVFTSPFANQVRRESLSRSIRRLSCAGEAVKIYSQSTPKRSRDREPDDLVRQVKSKPRGAGEDDDVFDTKDDDDATAVDDATADANDKVGGGTLQE